MNRRAEVLGAAALLLACALAYGAALRSAFQFDDWNVIVNYTPVHSLRAWFDALPSIRPLLKLSYTLNHLIDPGPTGFRLVNDLLHLANTALVFWVFDRLGNGYAGTRDTPDAAMRDRMRSAAFFAAIVFALHPVQTEAVTYVSGRSTSLCAFFILISLATWLAARIDASRRWLAWLSLLAFALALLCKEYAVVLPLALCLCLRMIVPDLRRPQVWRATRAHWLIALAAIALAFALPRYRDLLATSLDARAPWAALLTQGRAVVYLAGQLLRVDRLNADPDLPVITTADPVSVLVLTGWAALLILGLAAWRRQHAAGFALLWFLLWLAPTNSVLPRLDVANDRQLYLALIGPAWALGLWLAQVLARRARRTVLALVMSVLAALTFARNRVYADEITFWEDVTIHSPNKARAHNNLGYAYARACRLDAARMQFVQALRLDPNEMQAGVNLALLRNGNLLGVPPDCAVPTRR